jgi:hypothetical protein
MTFHLLNSCWSNGIVNDCTVYNMLTYYYSTW